MPNIPSQSSATSLRADVMGGCTTFLTMAYIVVVNPSILPTEGTILPFAGGMTATIVLAAAMSILMRVYASLPFGVTPGMGLNALLAFCVILGREILWPVAIGLVFWACVMFVLLSLFPSASGTYPESPGWIMAGLSAALLGLH